MKKVFEKIFGVTFVLSTLVMFVSLIVVIWTPDTGFSFYPKVFSTSLFCAIFSAYGGMWTC